VDALIHLFQDIYLNIAVRLQKLKNKAFITNTRRKSCYEKFFANTGTYHISVFVVM